MSKELRENAPEARESEEAGITQFLTPISLPSSVHPRGAST